MLSEKGLKFIQWTLFAGISLLTGQEFAWAKKSIALHFEHFLLGESPTPFMRSFHSNKTKRDYYKKEEFKNYYFYPDAINILHAINRRYRYNVTLVVENTNKQFDVEKLLHLTFVNNQYSSEPIIRSIDKISFQNFRNKKIVNEMSNTLDDFAFFGLETDRVHLKERSAFIQGFKRRYIYRSYKAAKVDQKIYRQDSAKRRWVPKSEKEYRHSQNKLYRLLSILEEARNLPGNFQDNLRKLMQEPADLHIKLGREKLKNPNWKRIEYRYATSSEEIADYCQVIDRKYNKTTRQPLSLCKEKLESPHFGISFKHENKHLIFKFCHYRDPKTQLAVDVLDDKSCDKEIKKRYQIYYNWVVNEATNEVTACRSVISYKYKYIQYITFDKKFCQDKRPLHLKWVRSRNRRHIVSCGLFTEEGYKFEETGLDTCEKKFKTSKLVDWIYGNNQKYVLGCRRKIKDGTPYERILPGTQLCETILGADYVWDRSQKAKVLNICLLVDRKKKATIRKVKNKLCVDTHKVSAYWLLDSQNKKVIGCQKISEGYLRPFEVTHDLNNCKKVQNLKASIQYRFTADKQKIIRGCEAFDSTSGYVLKDSESVDLKFCQNNAKTEYSWQLSDDHSSVLKCLAFDQATGFQHAETPLEQCIQRLPTQMQWEQLDSELVIGCNLFTQTKEKSFIKKLPIESCEQTLKIRYEWTSDSKTHRALGCHLYTQDKNLYIRNLTNIKECYKRSQTPSELMWTYDKPQKSVNGCIQVLSQSKIILFDKNIENCLSELPTKLQFEASSKDPRYAACKRYDLAKNYFIRHEENAFCQSQYESYQFRLYTDLQNKVYEGCALMHTENVAKPGLILHTVNLDKCLQLNIYQFEKTLVIDKNSQRATGCGLVEIKTSIPLKDSLENIEFCLEDLDPIKRIKTQNLSYKGCEVIDPNTGAILHELDPSSSCLEQFQLEYHYFVHKKGIAFSCGAFNKKHDLLFKVDDSNKCGSESLWLAVKADNSDRPVEVNSQFALGLTSQNFDKRYKHVKTRNAYQLAINSLIEDIKPHIIETSREVVFYNYRVRNKVKYRGHVLPYAINTIEHPTAIGYARNWREAILKHLPSEAGMLGWGLYAARDPYTGHGYGKDDPVLVLIRLPKGSRLYDLRSKGNRYGFDISEKTLRLLNQIHHSLYGTYLHKTEITKHKTHHRIFVAALRALKIDSLIYHWGDGYKSDIRFCDYSGYEGTAVLVGAELNSDTLKVFTPNLPSQLSDKENRWYERIHYAVNSSRGHSSARLFWPYRFQTISESTKEWAKRVHFSCNTKYTEDNPR